MKICLFQRKIKFNDIKYNLDLFKDVIINSKADLILFPEMSLTGFSMDKLIYDPIDELMELSIKYNKIIGIGYISKDLTNRYSIIDNNFVYSYDKIHLFSMSDESKIYNPGNKLVTCPICDFTLGISICYDLRFPEIFQELSKKANLIILPSFWPHKRIKQYHALLKARAIENQCYIIGINAFGNYDNLEYLGGSCCYNPLGEEVVLSFCDELIEFEISNDTLDYLEKFNVKKDRKLSLYKEFYE